MRSAAGIATVGLLLAGLVSVAATGGRRVLPTNNTSRVVERVAMRNGAIQRTWENGRPKLDATYRDDAYEGEYRSYYESGAPYELRHYVNGHEDGLQQSWTEDGVLYLNYDVHDGRRFGLVNASPCNTVGDALQARGSTPRRVANVGRGERALDEPGITQAGGPGGRSALPYYDGPDFSPRWSSVAHRVAPFSLETQTGEAISDAGLRGHPYVASFIYTQCAAVCPLLVGQLSRVQDRVAGTGARIVSFSVTPETDTPEVLARFGRERAIDPRTWSLVTGSKREIYRLARRSYFADDSRVGDSETDERAFLHTEKLLLVDADGRLRGVYNGTQPHAVDQLLADLGQLRTPGR